MEYITLTNLFLYEEKEPIYSNIIYDEIIKTNDIIFNLNINKNDHDDNKKWDNMCYFAKSKNFTCLSLKYITLRTLYEYQCNNCFTIIIRKYSIFQKNFICQFCNPLIRSKNLQLLRDYAHAINYTLLNTKYIYYNSQYKFQCNICNDILITNMPGIKFRKHCDICVEKSKLRELDTILTKNGYKLISTVFDSTKIILECKIHGQITRPAHKIRNELFCKECIYKERGERQKTPYEEVKKIINEKNLILLDDIYIGNASKLNVQCNAGHIFKISFHDIKINIGCSKCNINISEKICHAYFEYIFSKKFIKIRPDWLKVDNGYNLELDGFNDDLNLAFEYSGQQHYKFNNYFHKTNEDFLKQVKYDNIKKNICIKKNIILIVIPYTVTYDNMQKFITSECKKYGIIVPNVHVFDWKKFDIYNKSSETAEIDDMLGVMKYKHIDNYKGIKTKINIQCSTCNTIQSITPGCIKERFSNRNKDTKNCLTCYNDLKRNEIDGIVRKIGYTCIGKYTDCNSLIELKCLQCKSKKSVFAYRITRGTFATKCRHF